MSDPGRTIEIRAATPAGAACAAVLYRAGVPVRIIDSGTPLLGLAAVSTSLMGELGLNGSDLGDQVGTIIDRKLAEDDALDSARDGEGLLLVRRTDIVEALTSGIECLTGADNDGRALRVDAGEFRLGNPDLLDGDVLPLDRVTECILLDWGSSGTDRAGMIRLTGEGLSEVRATASILATRDQTTLILAVPMASTVETSISVVDLLERLLAHPSVRSEIPGTEPRWARSRLLRSGDPVHVTLGNGVRVRIGAAGGMADPVELDRELRSGIVAAEQIAQAIAAGRLSLARLSRIARAWSALEFAPTASA